MRALQRHGRDPAAGGCCKERAERQSAAQALPNPKGTPCAALRRYIAFSAQFAVAALSSSKRSCLAKSSDTSSSSQSSSHCRASSGASCCSAHSAHNTQMNAHASAHRPRHACWHAPAWAARLRGRWPGAGLTRRTLGFKLFELVVLLEALKLLGSLRRLGGLLGRLGGVFAGHNRRRTALGFGSGRVPRLKQRTLPLPRTRGRAAAARRASARHGRPFCGQRRRSRRVAALARAACARPAPGRLMRASAPRRLWRRRRLRRWLGLRRCVRRRNAVPRAAMLHCSALTLPAADARAAAAGAPLNRWGMGAGAPARVPAPAAQRTTQKRRLADQACPRRAQAAAWASASASGGAGASCVPRPSARSASKQAASRLTCACD